MDTTEWLRGLGLEQYAPAFREHDIDGEILRRLTAEDLREIGVLSVGHRRRLLDAIAVLGQRTADPESVPAKRDGIDDGQPVAVAEPQPSSRQPEPPARSGELRETESAFLGRDDELQLLLRRWQEAKAGDGRAVLISGGPGIGKSRLVAELAARIASEPHTRLRYFCSPYYQDTPLHPVVSQMEAVADFARGDTAEQKLEKLRLLLAPSSPDADEFAFVADLLSLPNAAADLDRSPQRKRERLLETLLRQIEALARRQPVLALIEDADWIDPTLRELLDLLVERMPGLPLLLLVTSTKDLAVSWRRRPHATSLPLPRLDHDDGAAVVDKGAGQDVIASEVVAKIIGRSEGVPLLLDELVAAARAGVDPDAAVAAIPAAGVDSAAPGILYGMLVIRLDRLGAAAQETAQLGAVLGLDFTHEMIAQVARRSDIDPALEQLVDAGLLRRRGEAPQSGYRFRHALVQDAVYAAIPSSRRQELHARVAATLEQRFRRLPAVTRS